MPTLLLVWVWLCAYLNCAGWLLSALHRLNAGGYAVALAAGLAALFFWKQKSGAKIFPHRPAQKFRRRFRRGFPLAFLILAGMAFLGGALYAPSNYDALAYRVPRVLHWLAAGQWHWIHAVFPRVNQRCCGIEWVSAPMLVLLKTDRFLFLINSVSFLFLPSLVFSVFTRLGVRSRAAWHWMWLAPTGYCFLLQAGSIGNDLFGAVFVMAALDFALRTKASPSARNFFTAVLAAALMTSAKPSNLPLLLPWSLAMLPSLPWLWRRSVRNLIVVVAAAGASFLPSAVLNWHFCHDWTGLKVETGNPAPAPFFLTGVNSSLLALQNFNPPVFPFNNWWHEFFTRHLSAGLSARLDQTMEVGLRTFDLDLLQMEEHAGLGFGVCVLLLLGAAARRPGGPARSTPWLRIVRWSPAVSLLVLLTQSRYGALCREVTPCYLPLLPLLLVSPAQAQAVRRRWWRAWAGMVFLMAAGLLVVSPARPLFPVDKLLASHFADERMRAVYSVYHDRNDAFAPVRALLPPGLPVLGLVTYDDPEASLWRPFGTVRVEHVCPRDTLADLQQRRVEYVLLNETKLQAWFQTDLAGWRQRMNAETVGKVTLRLRASSPPADWVVLKLPAAKPDSPNHP